MTSPRVTAVHEAGHAVAAYFQRVRFVTMTVVPSGDSLGSVRHQMPPSWVRPDIDGGARGRDWIERRTLVALAGPEAERVYREANSEGAEDIDALVAAGGTHDHAVAADLTSYVVGSPTEHDAYLVWLGERARGLVARPDFQRAVTALADAVLERGALPWRDARRIVQESIAPSRERSQR